MNDAMLYTRQRHALTGHVYERGDDGLVHVTNGRGEVSKFKVDGTWVEGPLTQPDPNMCNWVGGEQLPGFEKVPSPPLPEVPEGMNRRQMMAAPVRDSFRKTLGDEVMDKVPDAELLDSIYLTVFPNFHPWGSFNQIVYRFRPNGDNPEECIHECMYMAPSPGGAENRPPPPPVHWLGPDDDWVEAPELGMLTKVFNQDIVNMPEVQRGLKMLKDPHVIFANYGETKVRHFQELLTKWVED